jgi:hypothetical protein
VGLLEDIQVVLEMAACLIELGWLRLGQPVPISLAFFLVEI